jgi:cytosine/adenosine deaminase-related metal-dependent hydrolase
MSADLVVKNVRPMAGPAVDVLVRDGVIARLAPGIEPAPGATAIDGQNGILLPAFVDAHMHLDKTFWGLPWRPHDAGPTVLDRIENERRIRRALGLAPDVQAERLARQAVSRGTLHIRSHVDVDTDIGLRNLEGVMAARARLKDTVSIQIVAFPQSGVVARPGTAELLDSAVKEGAELIGGIDPAGIDLDPRGQLDVVFGIAGRHGAGVDIHLHDAGELGALQIRLIAERTRALGLAGKVAVSHAFCLGAVDDLELGRLIELLAESRIAIMTNAPGDRPMPPLRRLRAAGVTVFSGSDGVRDAWTPFGTADMLERAMLLAYRSGFRTDELLHATLDTVTRAGATVVGLERYGLDAGCRASFVVVPGETLGELVVTRPPRAWVVSAGRVVARDGACLLRERVSSAC